MTREQVLAAMRAAGLESPRIILFRTHDTKALYFDLCAGPNDPAQRRTERVAVRGTSGAKAAPADVEAAIARLAA